MLKFKDIRVIQFIILLTFSSVPVLVSSHQVNSLYDTSYFLTNGLRIAEGQIPYRDFVLIHNPGTFYIIAFFILVFGNVYWPMIAWMCFSNLFVALSMGYIVDDLGHATNRQKSRDNNKKELETKPSAVPFTSFFILQ